MKTLLYSFVPLLQIFFLSLGPLDSVRAQEKAPITALDKCTVNGILPLFSSFNLEHSVRNYLTDSNFELRILDLLVNWSFDHAENIGEKFQVSKGLMSAIFEEYFKLRFFSHVHFTEDNEFFNHHLSNLSLLQKKLIDKTDSSEEIFKIVKTEVNGIFENLEPIDYSIEDLLAELSTNKESMQFSFIDSMNYALAHSSRLEDHAKSRLVETKVLGKIYFTDLVVDLFEIGNAFNEVLDTMRTYFEGLEGKKIPKNFQKQYDAIMSKRIDFKTESESIMASRNKLYQLANLETSENRYTQYRFEIYNLYLAFLKNQDLFGKGFNFLNELNLLVTNLEEMEMGRRHFQELFKFDLIQTALSWKVQYYNLLGIRDELSMNGSLPHRELWITFSQELYDAILGYKNLIEYFEYFIISDQLPRLEELTELLLTAKTTNITLFEKMRKEVTSSENFPSLLDVKFAVEDLLAQYGSSDVSAKLHTKHPDFNKPEFRIEKNVYEHIKDKEQVWGQFYFETLKLKRDLENWRSLDPKRGPVDYFPWAKSLASLALIAEAEAISDEQAKEVIHEYTAYTESLMRLRVLEFFPEYEFSEDMNHFINDIIDTIPVRETSSAIGFDNYNKLAHKFIPDTIANFHVALFNEDLNHLGDDEMGQIIGGREILGSLRVYMNREETKRRIEHELKGVLDVDPSDARSFFNYILSETSRYSQLKHEPLDLRNSVLISDGKLISKYNDVWEADIIAISNFLETYRDEADFSEKVFNNILEREMFFKTFFMLKKAELKSRAKVLIRVRQILLKKIRDLKKQLNIITSTANDTESEGLPLVENNILTREYAGSFDMDDIDSFQDQNGIELDPDGDEILHEVDVDVVIEGMELLKKELYSWLTRYATDFRGLEAEEKNIKSLLNKVFPHKMKKRTEF